MIVSKQKLFLICCLILPYLSGCGGTDSDAPKGPMSYRGGGSSPIDVVTTEVSKVNFNEEFTALGTARAKESIDITSRSSNVINKIHFQEGEFVEAGTLLVELDNRELNAELAIKKASLKEINSQYKRLESLIKNNAITESELEEKDSEVKVSEAQLLVTQSKLDDTYIRAPFSGTLGLRAVSIGSLIQPSTQITTLDDTSVIRAIFAVPEGFLSTIKVGQNVDIKSAIFPSKIFKGSIKTINSRVDANTRNIFLVAEINNKENLIKPGMFLTVDINKMKNDSILIPEEAIAPRLGSQYVFVIKDNKALEVKVKLGSRIPGSIEILEGLQEGDSIVTQGVQKLRTGQPIKVVTTEQLKARNNVDF